MAWHLTETLRVLYDQPTEAAPATGTAHIYSLAEADIAPELGLYTRLRCPAATL